MPSPASQFAAEVLRSILTPLRQLLERHTQANPNNLFPPEQDLLFITGQIFDTLQPHLQELWNTVELIQQALPDVTISYNTTRSWSQTAIHAILMVRIGIKLEIGPNMPSTFRARGEYWSPPLLFILQLTPTTTLLYGGVVAPHNPNVTVPYMPFPPTPPRDPENQT